MFALKPTHPWHAFIMYLLINSTLYQTEFNVFKFTVAEGEKKTNKMFLYKNNLRLYFK